MASASGGFSRFLVFFSFGLDFESENVKRGQSALF